MWSLRRVRAGWGSDFPNLIHVVHYSIPPLKNIMLRELLNRASTLSLPISLSLSLLTKTPRADVVIFVPHCDYMLTNHLHDYQHLCRCIDEKLMCWTVSLSFLSWNPGLVSHSSLWRCFFHWEFHDLCFSQITLRRSTRSKISFHRITFIFPCSHILTFTPTLTPSAIMSWSSWRKQYLAFIFL